MAIDWITVSAQIVNFLVLVWLLKHFLYEPVMRAMEEREQRVAKRLSETQERERQADATKQNYETKAAELDDQREALLAGARDRAEEQRSQMLETAREDVAAMRANWRHQVGEEQEEFLRNLQRQAAAAIQNVASKVLAELADAELEDRVILKFIEQLRFLDKPTRKAMADTTETLRIRSAFELDSAARARLTRAVHEHITDDVEVEYEQFPDLVCGIELSSGGRRLSWNLADHLQELKARVDEAFAAFDPATGEVSGFAA